MKKQFKLLIVLLFVPTLLFLTISCSRLMIESDTSSFQLVSFYDLRDRDSFVQITNTSSTGSGRIHVQIFDVGNNCNENNFYDSLTINDTHVYNMRDITTNDGSPAGVVLPDSAYGIVVITAVDSNNFAVPDFDLIGNFRVFENTGYEYRTNSLSVLNRVFLSVDPSEQFAELYLNFNQERGVILSDVIGFTLDDAGVGQIGMGSDFEQVTEVLSADIVNINILVDVDILDLNENIFSCRNVIFACTDQNNPLLEELLQTVGGANVASFEYGINNAIPHSKGGELLCPGNNISDGFVRLRILEDSAESFGFYIGLNNGNGRGSMDSFWAPNFPLNIPPFNDGEGEDVMPSGTGDTI